MQDTRGVIGLILTDCNLHANYMIHRLEIGHKSIVCTMEEPYTQPHYY